MKYFIRQFWEDLHANYWFYPLILALLGLFLGLGTGYVDLFYKMTWFHNADWLYDVGPSGAREILSLIATTSITITSVSFSIGILILSQASNQFGPRVLINFMKHNKTQIVLGIFIGTFIFCLLNLRLISIHSFRETFFPSISLLFALVLGVNNFVVLIYFINMIAKAIQIDHILDNISGELNNTIIHECTKQNGEDKNKQEENRFFSADFKEKSDKIAAPLSGYVQIIDYETILGLAIRYHFFVEILKRPGQFIIQGKPIFQVLATKKLPDSVIAKLLSCLKIDAKRSVTQDVEFAFEEFVEIALRALSDAVHDPYTAISCLNKMSISLSLLGKAGIPSPYYKDTDGKLRLLIQTFSYEGVVDACFDRFRQEARRDMSVSIKMLDIISTLADDQLPEAFRKALLAQVELIYQGCQLAVHLSDDLNRLTVHYQQACQKLAISSLME